MQRVQHLIDAEAERIEAKAAAIEAPSVAEYAIVGVFLAAHALVEKVKTASEQFTQLGLMNPSTGSAYEQDYDQAHASMVAAADVRTEHTQPPAPPLYAAKMWRVFRFAGSPGPGPSSS